MNNNNSLIKHFTKRYSLEGEMSFSKAFSYWTDEGIHRERETTLPIKFRIDKIVANYNGSKVAFNVEITNLAEMKETLKEEEGRTLYIMFKRELTGRYWDFFSKYFSNPQYIVTIINDDPFKENFI